MTGALLVVASVALAEAGAKVDVPEAWIPLPPKLLQLVADDWRKGLDWGPVKATTGGLGWGPTDASAAVYVLWAVSEGEVAAPRPLMANRLGEVPARARRSSLKEGAVQIVAHDEQLAPTSAWATIEFAVPENGTRFLARTVLFVDEQGRLHEVRAECMFQDAAAAAQRGPCEATLASLAATVAIAAPPEGSAGGTPTLGPPNPNAQPMKEPPAEDGGRKGTSRVLLLGAGALVLALAVWFMSRRRHKEGASS